MVPASAEIQTDRGVILAACQQDGRALHYFHVELRSDTHFVLGVCRQNGSALADVAAELLQGDKVVVLTAASSDPDALRYVPTFVDTSDGILSVLLC
jgi:hypothetical protein